MAADPHREILVYIVRHGSTILNAQDCFRGTEDVSLDAAGARDAHKVAHYLQGTEFSHLIASDRKRAAETAAVIGPVVGLKPITTPALHAWNVGIFSGQPKNAENLLKLMAYIHDPETPIPDGESLNDFKRRIRPALLDAVDLACDCSCESCGEGGHKPVLLVSHSSVIHEVGDMLHGNHLAVIVEPGGVAAIYIEDGELKGDAVFKARPSLGDIRDDTIS